MVPEEVRRLFQVLTGEDMTDADEDALFAVAGRLESDAATVESLAPVVGNVVERVRGGFSGKAADRFAQRLAAFGPVLEAGAVGVRQLAEFVRNLALQVQYLKFVTVGGLLLLVAEIAWAVAMAGPTGGASMAWLAARFAVMRLLLTRWWGQLFMRLAMSQVVGIGLQVVMDAGAQGLQFALGTRKKWDAAMSEMAVGVGSFSGLLAVPLSALGNVVGNAISKVLVRGLGDKIDAEVLAAAARQVAEEHAEQYPVASMARFADVVSKNLEDYTGMSVRAMWVARFGHGLGESLEEGLTEMLGEAGYGAISGQGAQWNPFSFTAGVSEAIGSGIGNLAGLAVRGELIPAGRARDTGEKNSTDTDTDTARELQAESGVQADEKSDFAETIAEKPGFPTHMSDVDSEVPVTGTAAVADSEKAFVGTGIPVTSTVLPTGSAPGKTPPGDSSGTTGAGNGVVAEEDATGLSSSPGTGPDSAAHQTSVRDSGIDPPTGAAPSSGRPGHVDTGAVVGADSKNSASETPEVLPPVPRYPGETGAPGTLPGPGRLGTPPPLYSSPPRQDHVHSEAPDTGEPTGISRAATPPPPYSPAANALHTSPESSAVESPSDPMEHPELSPPPEPESVPASANQDGPPVSDAGTTTGGTRAEAPPGSDHTIPEQSFVDITRVDRDGPPVSDGRVTTAGSRVGAPPVHAPAGAAHANTGTFTVSPGVPVEHTAPLAGSSAPGPGGPVASEGVAPLPAASPPLDDHPTGLESRPDTSLSSVDRPGTTVDDPRAIESSSPVNMPLTGAPDTPDVLSGGVAPETTPSAAGAGVATEVGVALPGQVPARGDGTVTGAAVGTGPVAGNTDAARGGTPDSRVSPQSPATTSPGTVSPGGRVPGAGPVGLPADAVRVPVPAQAVSSGGITEFLRARVDDAGTGPVVLALGDDAGSGVVLSPNQAADVARSLGRDIVALVPGRGRRGPRWMRFDSDGARPRPVGAPGPVLAPQQTGPGHQELGAATDSATTVPTSPAAQARRANDAEPHTASSSARTFGQDTAWGRQSLAEISTEAAVAATSAARDQRRDATGAGHGTQQGPRPAGEGALPAAPVSLSVQGTGEHAHYTAWTRSPHHAATAPQHARPLLVLGHNDMVVSGDARARAHATGADVLARADLGTGPRWLLYRADGNRPRPVDPPAELTRRPRPEPLLFQGPRDSGELIERAARLAPHLLDTQIVGVHVTGDGRAVLADGSLLEPEGFAAHVQQDRRFVPGPDIALLGCAAYQRPRPDTPSFAERFTRALGERAWVTDTEVFQTTDGAVHATETVITGDGRMLPMFPDGQGTGHWSLLDPDGHEVLSRRGPELRAALTGATPPRYTDQTRPEPVIKWSDDEVAESRQPLDELLSEWWAAHEDGVPSAGRQLSDEDVHRLADAAELRYREGMGGQGTRSGERLRGRLVHVLELTRELGGQPTTADVRDIRLIADWIRDTGRMPGPTVTAADVDNAVQELTEATNTSTHELRYLADVLRRAGQEDQQLRATVPELRAQWRHGATQAVTLRMGARTDNAVVYAVGTASLPWWRRFHGGGVDLGQLRREMGIPADREPVIVVVEARRRTAAGVFVIGDEVRGTTSYLDTPRELGERVAGTAQYQRIAANNQDGPVVLVVTAGSTAFGGQFSLHELTHGFAEGLSAGGGGNRQVLVAEGNISFNPPGFRVVPTGLQPGNRQNAGLVLPSGIPVSVLTLRRDSARENTIAYPIDNANRDAFQQQPTSSDYSAQDIGPDPAQGGDAPIFVLAQATAQGEFIVTDLNTGETQHLSPRGFAHRAVQDARSHGITRPNTQHAYIVRTYDREREHAMPEGARQQLADAFRDAGHRGPIRVTAWDTERHRFIPTDVATAEEAQAEALRADEAGEPYTPEALGQRFGRSREWGQARLAEFSAEAAAPRSGPQPQQEAEREAARAEARRALDAGVPYTAAALGQRFGRSTRWARVRLAEIRNENAAPHPDPRGRQTQRARDEARAETERAREAARAETERMSGEARAEARRARDAGEPYTSMELGRRFGRSRAWGLRVLAGLRDEDAATGPGPRQQAQLRPARRRLPETGEREQAREAVRQAALDGRPYTAATLGQRFGRSRAWAVRLLAEVRNEGAATGPGSRQQAQLRPDREAGEAGPRRVTRASVGADARVGQSAAGGMRPVGEMLRGWWAASADPAAAAGRVLSDEDVRRLADAVDLRYRDGVGEPGSRSADRLRGRLVHALMLTERVGGRPVVEDVRDVRLVADWIRDTGAMRGPAVFAADVHRVVQELTGGTTDARRQDVQFLADVVRRVQQRLEQAGEQRPATVEEVRAQWRRQATRIVTVAMGGSVENTVVYPVDEISARWWRSFRGDGVDPGQVRGELGIAGDREPVMVVVEARRLTRTGDRSFLIGDEVRGTSVQLETPGELGQRVADTEQYQRVAGNNPDSPVVLIVLGGTAGLHLSHDILAQRFAEGLTTSGESVRQVLLAEGYISHAPAGLGLIAAGSRRGSRQGAPGLVLSSEADGHARPDHPRSTQSPDRVITWPSRLRLAIPVGPNVIHAVTFPRNRNEEAVWRRWAESGPDLAGLLAELRDESPILVLANQRGRFRLADPETWAPLSTDPEDFGAAVAEALAEETASNPSRAVVVFAVQPLSLGNGLTEEERRALASGISRNGHDGPIYVAEVEESNDGDDFRFEIQNIALAGGHPRNPELPVRELNSSDPGRPVLAAGGTEADADWWNRWSANGVQVGDSERLGLDSTTVVLARLRGGEFVTPSGTLSAFEFGRQVAGSVPYQTSITQRPDAPVLLATVGAETGLSEDAAHEFARGVRGNDPDRTVLVTDRDFRLRRENDLAILPLEADLLRFVPPPNWSPVAEPSRPADDTAAVLVYPSPTGPEPTPTVDRDWFASETGHRRPLVVMARSVRGRFHVLEPSTDQTRVLGPSDFGTSVARSTEFQQALTDDPARPVVVVFNQWPSGLTELDARVLAEGLRGDGIQRPVFLSLGPIHHHQTGPRPYALIEAPSTQSALSTHPASAADAQRPLLISSLARYDTRLTRLRSVGVTRLLSQLGYPGTQQPIVVLTSRQGDFFIAPGGTGNVPPARMGAVLAENPDYLEAIRGDWRRPVVIVPVGGPNDPDARTRDFTDFTTELLGNPDADRPVYIAENNIRADRLASPEDERLVEPGLRLLTPDRMRPPPPRDDMVSHALRVGVDQESAVNAVAFPPGQDLPPQWTGWGSLERTWYGPALRRAMSEFDPDPLFVFVPVRDGQIVVRNATGALDSPDPVALGLRMQRSSQFQHASGHIDRTVVIVADSFGPRIPDWYARALAEGLRRTGGPPRPVYVYDGYHHEAFDTDAVLNRLRNVTPELSWQRPGDVRDPDDPLEIVPRYRRDLPPSYDSAGEVASAVTAVDRQRQAALSSAARATQPAEATEAEIAAVHLRWNEQFHEAERTLSTLPANWVADLQARARTILGNVWPRPRQGDTLSAMAMQGLWDRMTQRVAFRLYHDGRSETGAWADAAAMAATVPSLPVVLAVRGSDEPVTYPAWTRSPGYAQHTPDRDRLLVVLGSDHAVVPGELIAEVRRSGDDVLARTDTTEGPQWILFRADGSEPLPVETPAELTRLASPAPLMVFGPDDDAVAAQAEALASGLPGVQVVGIHITPAGNAQWPDGQAGPEESAARVWRDRRFVAGLPVVLFGCGAGQQPRPGETSFAQRFAASMRSYVWTTNAGAVWQTSDGAVHATETTVTADGRMQPVFTNGQGTGQWSLLGPDGQELLSHRGPELRAALTGSTPPRYPEQARPEPVIRWSENEGAESAEFGARVGELGDPTAEAELARAEAERARAEARRAHEAGEPYTAEALAARFGRPATWGIARLAEMREQLAQEQEARTEARRARAEGVPYTAEALRARFLQDSEWAGGRLEESRQPLRELLSGWWAAREDSGSSAGRRLSDDDVRRLADAVDLRYRDGVDRRPGSRGGERLRGRLVHVLELTEELGGQPTVADVRDIRLIADWIRDTGRMPGPTVTATDLHNVMQELTEFTTNPRPHELRYLADVLRQVEQEGQQRRATVPELRAQWRHGATQAVTLRMGAHTDNTVAYPASTASSRWWRQFHGGRVDLDQLRREMRIPADREPVIVVVEARRRTAGAEKSFLISDEVRGSTARLDTPRELGQRVAGTAQYQRIATTNPQGPVVLVVTGGNAALGPHLSSDRLAQGFADGLNAGGDSSRQVLLAEGYISHDPAGLGLVGIGTPATTRQHAGLVLPSGVQPSVLALRQGSTRENTIAYPIDATDRDTLQRRYGPDSARTVGSSSIFVLARITDLGGFVVADRNTWRTQQVSPREFARRAIEDARSHGITHPDDRRALVVDTYDRGRGALPERARQELAEGFREAGHRGPVHVMKWDAGRNRLIRTAVVPWSPRVRLTIPAGPRAIDAIAYPHNSDEEAAWRRWAESVPSLDWLSAQVRDESPILVLASREPASFAYTDPETRDTRQVSEGEFGRIVAGELGELAASNPGKTVVVLAMQRDFGVAMGEQARQNLARGVHRYGHDGPVYVATAVVRNDAGRLRLRIQDVALAGGRPRETELPVRSLTSPANPRGHLLAAGGTSADVDWWRRWSSRGFWMEDPASVLGSLKPTVVLSRLSGEEFVTPSGTLSAFEFGRQLAHSAPYRTEINALPDAPVLLATVGAETGLSEHAAHAFARGVRSTDPDRTIFVTDQDFRLRNNGHDRLVLPISMLSPPRLVPLPNWSPVAGPVRPADDDFGPVVTYSPNGGQRPLRDLDTGWIASEVGHSRPFVVVASPQRGRFLVLDPQAGRSMAIGPSDFGTIVTRNAEFQQSVSDDPARPVVVVLENWPSGLTEQDARSLAAGLRSDGIRRPVFLSMGEFTNGRSHALIEAPSAQSASLTHPASALQAQRPTLISSLHESDARVRAQLRSYGLSRLLTELGYRSPHQPIVLLVGRKYFQSINPDEDEVNTTLAAELRRNPDYLETTRGDWRRPIVILPVGGPDAPNASTRDLAGFTSELLGAPNADRPVYIAEHNVRANRLAVAIRAGSGAVGPGLRLLTQGQTGPPARQVDFESHALRVGVSQRSAFNAVAFPAGNGTMQRWREWGSLDYAGYGPMLRRAIEELDPDPLFVLVQVRDEQIVVRRTEGGLQHASPDPLGVGVLIQRSAQFLRSDAKHESRTVVIVPDSVGTSSLPDWYARALVEGLRRVGGPPRPVYVYDGFYHEADDTDMVLDRLRSVTPELHWRQADQARDPDASREILPRYQRDSPPSYDSAGEAASAVAAVDRQREAALSGATRPAQPAEVTETDIATLHRRWSEEFREAERALSALSADWVADLQARARTILESLWPRPRQGDTHSAMAMQDLWDRMAQRIAFRLSGDELETGAWAQAAAMAASVVSLPAVRRVPSSDDSAQSSDESAESSGQGASRAGTAELVSGGAGDLPGPGVQQASGPSEGPLPTGSGLPREVASGPSTAAGSASDAVGSASDAVGSASDAVGSASDAVGSALDMVAEFAELTGRMQRHLATLPPDFRPEVRQVVDRTRRQVAARQNWTPAQLENVRSGLPQSRQVEQSVRSIRRRMVRQAYDRARESMALGRDPVMFFPGGVPGGVSSRADVRFGLEVEFRLPDREFFDGRLESLGTRLRDQGLVDWLDAVSSLLTPDEANAAVTGGKWALVGTAADNQVAVVSPVLRAGAWTDVARVLEAARGFGGDARESAGRVNVSLDWPLTPEHYVRLAQLVKAFEALLYRLGNVEGSGAHRNLKGVGPMPLPVALGTLGQGEKTQHPYDPVAFLNSNKRDTVRFHLDERDGHGRTEFRLWAGSLKPAMWQARAELSAAMELAVTDPTIYRALEQRMIEPDLLGRADPGLGEDARLEQLLDFLTLLPLGPAAQTQLVQLFAATRPWQDTGDNDPEYSAQTVGLPDDSMLLPTPGTSKASAVAAAYSYQLYENANLILASATPDHQAIQLWDGRTLGLDGFARMLVERRVGLSGDKWTVLAIHGGVPPELPGKVLESGRSRVLVPSGDLHRTGDGRLMTGRSFVDGNGVVTFQPGTGGWIEFRHGSTHGRPTGKADLGEALTEAADIHWPDAGHQSRPVPRS
ncbi:WXG100-like domain-containing protein [Saccharopolyspora phatthalungensis]